MQMYLCVLREAVGLPDDSMLPDSLEEFQIPSTVSVARYRRKVGLLMEKYKGYYMQERSEEQTASVLHPAFAKQRDSLVYGVVNESINARGAQESVLDREKVFELLEAHHTDVFKERVIEFIHAVEVRVRANMFHSSETRWYDISHIKSHFLGAADSDWSRGGV